MCCAEEDQTEDVVSDTADATDTATADDDLGSSRDASKTDDEVVQR